MPAQAAEGDARSDADAAAGGPAAGPPPKGTRVRIDNPFVRIFGPTPPPADFEETKRREREALEREEMVKRAREAAKREHERNQRIAQLQAATGPKEWGEIKAFWKAVPILLGLSVILAGVRILILNTAGANGWATGALWVAVLAAVIAVIIFIAAVSYTFQFWMARSELHDLTRAQSASGSPSSPADGPDRAPEKPGS